MNHVLPPSGEFKLKRNWYGCGLKRHEAEREHPQGRVSNENVLACFTFSQKSLADVSERSSKPVRN